MADDIASLVIRVNSLDAKLADTRLKGLAQQGGRAERATGGLTAAFLKFAGPAALIAGAIGGLRKAMAIEREFGILNSGLITATGSAENAAIAFKAIEEFAANTPYDLAQATTGFTKLVNLGLDPSIRAMTSYGDTAAAMGKDLNSMIEAVADAGTGEFERLKEFGIKAKTEGDNVTFTFRGVKTTVKKEAADIEGYLIGLGELNFSGAMTRRMGELDGKLSNMGDSWDGLWRTINSKGLDDAMGNAVSTATAAIEEFEQVLSSGSGEAAWEAYLSMFDGFQEDWDNGWKHIRETGGQTLTDIIEYMDIFAGDAGDMGKKAVDAYVDFFTYLPLNIRYIIKRVGIEISALVDYAIAYGGAITDIFVLGFKRILDRGEVYFDAIGAMMSFESFDLDSGLAKVDAAYSSLYQGVYEDAEASAAITREERIKELGVIDAIRDADISAYDSRIAKAKELHAVKEEKSEEGVLGGFRVKVPEVVPNKDEELEFWSNYLSAAEESLTSLDELATSTIDRFSQGAGDAFAAWVTGASSGEDAMQGFLKNIVTGTISALGQMAAQWLAYQAVQLIIGKTAAAGAAVGLTAEASAASLMSGIHAFSSTAAIPIVGPALAPAAMGAALAVTGPMATAIAGISAGMVAGAFDEGGHIPAGKVGMVGEYGMEIARGPTNITSREDTLSLLKAAGQNKGQQTNQQSVMNVNLNVQTIDSRSFDDYLQGSSSTLMGMIQMYKESMGERF
jgi:hypothetical protein